MKLQETTIVLWDFKRLFRYLPYVWADVNFPRSGLKEKKFGLYSVEIRSHTPHNDLYDGARLVRIVLHENLDLERSEKGGGLYGMNFAQTMKAAGAEKEGFISRGSLDGWWRMEKNEQFCDAAIRVGRRVFEIMKIRAEAPKDLPANVRVPTLSPDDLFSMFVVYKVTWVDNRLGIRFDDYLRQKHGLKEAPRNLRSLVL